MNKDFFEMGKAAKGRMNFFLACLLAYGFVLVGGIVGEFNFIFPDLPEYIRLGVFSLTIGFGMATVLIFLYVKFKEKRTIASLGFEKDGFVKKYLIGFLVGLGLFTLAVLLGVVFGGIKLSINPSGFKFHIIGVILFGFLIQGATEEILCRGWLMQALGAKYTPVFAVVISSLFFMILHGANPGITLLPLINLALFGVFAAVYTINEKGLWGICGFHSAWNWVQGSVYGIKVSGTTVPGGSVLNSEIISGKDLINGGAFGIEGSIVCSVIFLIATVAIVMMMKRKEG